MAFCVRKTDGSIWEPSTPDGYTRAQAFADAASGRLQWYFRGGLFVRRGWWPFRAWRWQRDGTVWKPTFGSDFKVMNRADAIEHQRRGCPHVWV